MSDDRVYSREEAEELLPQIIPMLEALRDAQSVMEERHDQIMQTVPGNGGGEASAAYLAATLTAANVGTALDNLSIELRDASTGLIDFPGQRDGQPVWLCFRLGETAVAWWHPIDQGFSSRLPL